MKVPVHVVRAAGAHDLAAAFDRVRAVNAAGLVVASDTYFALMSEPLAALGSQVSAALSARRATFRLREA